ncbi:MAG: cytochrome ubiquinol oxidase subunit I [Methylohalobius crimeensis]
MGFDDTVVNLSRLQFAITALYHFLFVPLTLGLSFIMAIMESVYVMTGREVYREMTRFWGKLFGINYALGVTTGLPLEFQFGTNWAYYSHYVGDVFGPILAAEGLIAFFLESTFIGLFFLGWNRLSQLQHLIVTWLLAVGGSLSALWILIANAWMQYPVGAEFNFDTLRMELASFPDVFFNPVAQVKFVHTVAAGYTTGAMFVLGVSAWYLLKGRHLAMARRSFAIAASFGLASVLSVIVLGDESGYSAGETQKVKLAAIEAAWETEEPPAGFALFGFPDQAARTTHYEIKIPYVLGLIATRSVDEEVLGIEDLEQHARKRIHSGLIAYRALEDLRRNREDAGARATLAAHQADLGYALLLKRYRDDVLNASEAEIERAVRASIPHVAPLFWTFRGMVAAGFLMLFIFAAAFYYCARRVADRKRWLLKLAFYGMPLPWLASELGWFVAEYGRQPWTISGVLPTFLSASNVKSGDVWLSLSAFIGFYSVLLVVEMFLMVKLIRQGPAEGQPVQA